MKLRLTLVLLSCVISVVTGLVIARGGSRPTTGGIDKKPTIGLSLDTLKEERWQRDRDTFVRRATELGAEVRVQSANSNDAQQVQDIRSLINMGVDVIVIAAHNGEAMTAAIEECQKAGIATVAYDRLIKNCEIDLYMSFDNERVGELQGKFLVDALAKKGGGKKRIVRIYGAKTDNNASQFKAGQDKALAAAIKSGDIEVVHDDWADDWKPENAKKIMSAAISKGGTIDAVLASNDGTAGGAIQALVEEGLAGKVIVTGQDAELAACQRIVSGTQSMTIYKPLKKLAELAAETAVKLAKGKPVIAQGSIENGKTTVPAALIDVVTVTKENMDSTIVADSFHPRDLIYKGTQDK
jgi:D-xylose transport system substrate-binding protein